VRARNIQEAIFKAQQDQAGHEMKLKFQKMDEERRSNANTEGWYAPRVNSQQNVEDFDKHVRDDSPRNERLGTKDIGFRTNRSDIPKYRGSFEKITPFEYLESLERIKESAGYSEKYMFEEVLPAALDGKAYDWFKQRRREIYSWPEFRTAFRTAFQAPDYYYQLKKELDYRYQGPDESMTSFIITINSYFDRMEKIPPESEIVQKIIDLMHPNCRRMIQGYGKPMVFYTISELYSEAENVQARMGQDQHYKEPLTYSAIEPTLVYRPRSGIQGTRSARTEPVRMNGNQSRIAGWENRGHESQSQPRQPGQRVFVPQAQNLSQSENTLPQGSRPISPIPRVQSSGGGQTQQAGVSQDVRATFQPPHSQANRACHHCGDPNHFIRDCPLKRNSGNGYGPSRSN
jgi:hypothetical protein